MKLWPKEKWQVGDEKNNKKMKQVRTKVDLDKHVTDPGLNQNMESPN